MRTKVLCAAALAVGALTSMAQVYSANVVGYVNVTMPGNFAFSMVANPLDGTMGGAVAGGNNITNIFKNANAGDLIFRWNPSIGDFDSTTPNYGANGWDSNFNLNPGEGILYLNEGSAPTTVTFVGQVNQGTWNYPGAVGGTPGKVLGNFAFNMIGAPFPIGGSFTNSILGLPASNGDLVFTWNPGIGDFDAVTPNYGASGWDNTQVQIAPGIGFLYLDESSSPTVNWSANFTVQ